MNIRNHQLSVVLMLVLSIPFLLLFSTVHAAFEEKPIVLLITSYNNSQWYKGNLDAAFAQNYSNFRIIYVDDCSSDRTGELVEQYVHERGWADRVTLIKNTERKLKMENFYNAVHQLCADHVIVIDYDGDDRLFGPDVLSIVNAAYADPNIWMTYGSYVTWPVDIGSNCHVLPEDIVTKNAYRDHVWTTTHLKTFYAWLFKRIDPEHLKYEGKFVDMACDIAFMFPMLEMASGRFKYITDLLYIYNRGTVFNDDKTNRDHQWALELHLRKLPHYKRLNDHGQIYY
jgi:glycosyltransferase involved in cell wall biosynthesis